MSETVGSYFDRFASSYDRQLERLEYRAPALVASAVATLGISDARILDAGCGTGLGGLAIAEFARDLTGVDLSPAMLARAARRGIYRDLFLGDMVEHMSANPRWDLVVAVDVFPYLGDLGPVLRAAAHAVDGRGYVAFTTERLIEPADQDFRAGPGGRHAHARAHIERSLAAAGLEPVALDPVPQLRLEQDEPVPGWVCVARSR